MHITVKELVGRGFGFAVGYAQFDDKDNGRILATIVFWKWRLNLVKD